MITPQEAQMIGALLRQKAAQAANPIPGAGAQDPRAPNWPAPVQPTGPVTPNGYPGGWGMQ